MAHHRRGLRRLLDDEALVAALEADFTTAPVDARRRAILHYAAKLTLAPSSVERADVEALRAAGLDDADVLAVAEVVGYYAYVNRIADGLGVALETQRDPRPRPA